MTKLIGTDNYGAWGAKVGFLDSAGDHSPQALDDAHHNAVRVNRTGWCVCDDVPGQVYWRWPEGGHGWACIGCGRVTQVG